MTKDKTERDDPTWGRSKRNVKKNHKMCSRGSMKVLRSLIKKKRAADKLRRKTVCVTRTVDLPSTQNVGDERNKLLFMLAMGLIPTPGLENRQFPLVMLERLDPILEAQAATKTTERIFELFQRRQIQSIQGRIVYHVKVKPSKNVEIVDLVSSDDDSSSGCADPGTEDESSLESVMICSSLGFHKSKVQKSRSIPPPVIVSGSPWFQTKQNCQIVSCSRPRQPVFKPIVNNQDSGIFRNWKPESMTRLINPRKSEEASNPVDNPSKLLTSLKSIPSNPSLDFRKFPSRPYQGGTCKSQVHGSGEETSSSDFIGLGSETVITID